MSVFSDRPQLLYIEPLDPPYVVKNPKYGKEGGGPVELEVPWRESTTTRSARRGDLLRLLMPIQHYPSVAVLSGSLKTDLKRRSYLAIELQLFQDQPLARATVAHHQVRGRVALDHNTIHEGKVQEFEVRRAKVPAADTGSFRTIVTWPRPVPGTKVGVEEIDGACLIRVRMILDRPDESGFAFENYPVIRTSLEVPLLEEGTAVVVDAAFTDPLENKEPYSDEITWQLLLDS